MKSFAMFGFYRFNSYLISRDSLASSAMTIGSRLGVGLYSFSNDLEMGDLLIDLSLLRPILEPPLDF